MNIPSGPKRITDSCYLIRRFDKFSLWDTGFAASYKGHPRDLGEIVVSLDKTIPEQLAGAWAQAVRHRAIVGLSHTHADHTGQAADFPNARLVGRQGGVFAAGGRSQGPIHEPWRSANANVTLATDDVDIFGDGSVIALHTPGHTPDHLSPAGEAGVGPG